MSKKITAITSSGDNLSSRFSLRFGQSKYFCIYNEEDGDNYFIENEYAAQRGGAGVAAAQKLINLGINKVVSGEFGRNVSSQFQRANIQMVTFSDGKKTIKDVIDFINAYH